MIRFENLTKIYTLEGRRTVVADNLNTTFPTGRAVALMGRNGAGKSSLLRMVAGTMDPTWGRIVSDGTISWPVGFAGSFHNELTGAQNVRFVARIYGVDTDELVDFVQDFAEVGQHFHMPIKSYSSGMKSRLTFGTSMGIAFDTYLIDEVTAVGDASFKAKSARLFADRMRNSGALMVSHSMGQIRQLCDAVVILEDGHLTFHDDVDRGIREHEQNMKRRA